MPTPLHAVFSSLRRRFLPSNAVANRNAKRSKRVSFSDVLSLLLIELFFVPLFGFVGCALAPKPKLPEVVGETPTFEELQTAVNANSSKIETIFASDASLGVVSTPGWAKCQIAFERPGNLRLVGSAPTMGRVVDVGCNEERFWFWSDFQNSDELYFCRHDQYQNSAAANVLPLDPTWFPEAFGLVELKDDELVDGPTRQEDGSLLVTTKKTRSDGVYLKRLYFEPKTAAILRQDVQAPSGETVVSIRCKRSVYLETPGVVLPQKLEIECPRADASLILDVGSPILNDSSKIADEAFKQPTDLKAKAIDLGAATAQVAAQTPPTSAAPAASLPQASAVAPNANAGNNGSSGFNAADASTAPNVQTVASLSDSTRPKVRMFARARVEAVAPDAQTIAALPTAATAQIPQNAQNGQTVQSAPTFQAPQNALLEVPALNQIPQNAQNGQTVQSAPTFQTPQNDLLEVPALSQIPQNAPTLENFDPLLPVDAAPSLPANSPTVKDVPAPVGPRSEVVGAPRASF
ncbi:MAG: hypothetical protein IJ991_17475 [Thermoguttaceae bacterium]|nr:hypothetical protein [Thermoguttaceae bacterium]